MNRTVRTLLIFLVVILSSCTPSSTAPQATIVAPIDCRVKTDGEMPLSIVGYIPEKAEIKWEATAGTVIPDNGVAVIYHAPSNPGNVMITANISSGGSYTVSYPCLVEVGSSQEAQTTPSPVEVPVIEELPTEVAVTIVETSGTSIAISEVLGDPCGGDLEESANEYVELFNYGDTPVDVTGWFIAITREDAKGDRLVPWQTRYPKHTLGTGLVLNSGVIPPGSYAVVLSPFYSLNKSSRPMPYSFPKGTVILTVETGKRIGNDHNGILGSDAPADGVFIYIGTNSNVESVISTYGVESVGMEPGIFKRKSGLPLIPKDCNSVQRVIPTGGDFPENWEIVPYGNPGEGP